MNTFTIVSREGIEKMIDGVNGRSVMELIRDSGVDELLAICGGCCSCATCHVYVDPSWVDRLPPIGEDENDLLEGASARQSTSRLSCQLKFGEALAGLRVTVAPED